MGKRKKSMVWDYKPIGSGYGLHATKGDWGLPRIGADRLDLLDHATGNEDGVVLTEEILREAIATLKTDGPREPYMWPIHPEHYDDLVKIYGEEVISRYYTKTKRVK